jgi:hypothetical protein
VRQSGSSERSVPATMDSRAWSSSRAVADIPWHQGITDATLDGAAHGVGLDPAVRE